jgi:hypothetical protein
MKRIQEFFNNVQESVQKNMGIDFLWKFVELCPVLAVEVRMIRKTLMHEKCRAPCIAFLCKSWFHSDFFFVVQVFVITHLTEYRNSGDTN